MARTVASSRRKSSPDKAAPATRKTPARKTPSPRARRAKPDAVALLKEDHRSVEAKFERYEKIKERADDARKAKLVEEICAELDLHAEIEEKIFYPAARDAMKDQDLLDEAEVEHASLKELIAQLRSMTPSEDLYDAKVKVLSEYVKHHVKEEERELFKEARAAGLDMKALGEELAAAKAGRGSRAPAARAIEQSLR